MFVKLESSRRFVSSTSDNSGAQVRMCCHGPHTGINADVTDQRFSTEFNNVDTAHTELVNTFVTFLRHVHFSPLSLTKLKLMFVIHHCVTRCHE